MYRENIPKDGDCCFRAVARNIFRLTQRSEIDSSVTGHLAHLGLLNLNESALTDKLRALTVSEWSGENRHQYESFLTTDSFETEVELFKHRGYFTGELGNLMVLAMANVLKTPIVIFSSLENFPTIPKWNVPTFLVLAVLVEKVKGSCQIFATTSLGNTQAGASVLKQEFDVVEIVHAKDVQTHLVNGILEIPRWSALLESVIKLIHETGEELSAESLLRYYAFVQPCLAP